MTAQVAAQITGKTRANGHIAPVPVKEQKSLKLEDLTNAQLVTMSHADVRANLRTLIDYSDQLLTRSSVIYTLILTTAEAMTTKPVPFFISAFADVWPKSDKPEKDGTFALLGFSTVELKIRDKKLSLTEAQQDAYRKVNAFSMWIRRQKEQKPGEGGNTPAAKVLPKKLVEAIGKLRYIIDNAQEVDILETRDGKDYLHKEKVVPVALVVEIVTALEVI